MSAQWLERHAARAAWLFACCLLAPLETRALTVDTWVSEQTTTAISPAGTSTSFVTGAGILGGEREVAVTRTSGVAVTMVAASGSLAHGQIAGSFGTGTVIWDGVDGGGSLAATGLGGVDFTDAGASAAIAIPLLFNDLPSVLTLTVYTDASNASQAVVGFPGNVPPDPQSVLTILFSSFSVLSGSGADFANVGALVLQIDGSAVSGLDVEIGAITTVPVPEPHSVLLVGAGLVALCGWGRRTPRA